MGPDKHTAHRQALESVDAVANAVANALKKVVNAGVGEKYNCTGLKVSQDCVKRLDLKPIPEPKLVGNELKGSVKGSVCSGNVCLLPELKVKLPDSVEEQLTLKADSGLLCKKLAKEYGYKGKYSQVDTTYTVDINKQCLVNSNPVFAKKSWPNSQIYIRTTDCRCCGCKDCKDKYPSCHDKDADLRTACAAATLQTCNNDVSVRENCARTCGLCSQRLDDPECFIQGVGLEANRSSVSLVGQRQSSTQMRRKHTQLTRTTRESQQISRSW